MAYLLLNTTVGVLSRLSRGGRCGRIGKEVGREASQVMHQFILQLYNARKNPNGNMALWDPGTHSHVTLEQDLPEEAYRQLAQMGPELLEGQLEAVGP